MMLFRSELLHIILCKEVKSYEKNWLEYQMKETGIFWNNLTFYRSERKLVITLQFFLHRMLFNYILAGIFIGSLVKIFAEKIASVQTGTNFPAKSLSIYTKFFSLLNMKLVVY